VIDRELSGSPDLRDAFHTLLSHVEEGDFAEFLSSVDESDYSFSDWAEAFAVFDRWLAAKGEKTRPFDAMRGYIACCAAMSAPQISLISLKVIVNQALADHGFAAIRDSQI